MFVVLRSTFALKSGSFSGLSPALPTHATTHYGTHSVHVYCATSLPGKSLYTMSVRLLLFVHTELRTLVNRSTLASKPIHGETSSHHLVHPILTTRDLQRPWVTTRRAGRDSQGHKHRLHHPHLPLALARTRGDQSSSS